MPVPTIAGSEITIYVAFSFSLAGWLLESLHLIGLRSIMNTQPQRDGAFPSTRRLATAIAAALEAMLAIAYAAPASAASPLPEAVAKTDIGFVDVRPDIKLRHMVVRSAHPKGTVLFLHGFPETLYAWKDIAQALGSDYEVHAFDWPGYGLSSRPSADRFSYAPKDYARVLKDYIDATGIDKSRLVIYATDIGALPALLLALDDPQIARKIVVGDFAPFDRPQYMAATLQSLKVKETADVTHAAMNKGRDDVLANFYRRGFSREEQFDISLEFAADMAKGWNQENLTSADASITTTRISPATRTTSRPTSTGSEHPSRSSGAKGTSTSRRTWARSSPRGRIRRSACFLVWGTTCTSKARAGPSRKCARCLRPSRERSLTGLAHPTPFDDDD